MLRLVLVFLIAFSKSVILAQIGESPILFLDGYTISGRIDSPANLPLGTTLVLACRFGGISSHRQAKFTWMCLNESCLQNGYAGRSISSFPQHNESVLAINITSENDNGTYACTVSPKGLQSIKMEFKLNVTGGKVVHSYGRLILNEGVISDRQQLQPRNNAEGDWMIECRVSSGEARLGYFGSNHTLNKIFINQTVHHKKLNTTVVIQRRDLPPEKFAIEGICANLYHYLFLEKDAYCCNLDDNVKITPGPSDSSVTVTIDTLPCYIARAIVGYSTLVAKVWVDVEYVNLRECGSKTFSLVYGSKYRITVWGLTGGNIKDRRRCRSPTVRTYNFPSYQPASCPRALTPYVSAAGGMGLNWIPPRDPNGEITGYYVKFTKDGTPIVDYAPYNYYPLNKGHTYTKITVMAINGAGPGEESEMLNRILVP